MVNKNNNRDVAISNGLKTYIGKPCKSCGKEEKYVSNWACVNCATNSTKNRSPEIYKKYIKSDKGKEWKKEYSKTKPYRDTQNRWVTKDYEKNKEKYHGYNLKKYGMDRERYQTLLVEQKYCCAICNQHQDNLNQKLAVDHNHETGIVRALLCGPCNTSLGLLKEDRDIMKNMINYIERFQCALL